MPSYPYLQKPAAADTISSHMTAMRRLGVPYTDDEIANAPKELLRPASIERLGRGTLRQRALYPYLGDFWVAYRVRFPRVRPDGRDGWLEGAPGFVLKVGSTLGQASLRFPAAAEGGADAR